VTADRTPVIEVEDLAFAYGDGQPVLEDVGFTIDEHDFACVVGPNGGGKTTLLRLMLGLLQPSAGSIRILGASPIRARPDIGYLPQHAMLDVSFPVSVMDVVLMGRLKATRRVGPYSRADRDAALESLAEVGLEGFERRAFAALSGGERQRVLVARALASRPRLLLLDEPAAGLDLRIEEEFFQLLRRLNEAITVVLVSHDLGFVASFVKTVVCVNRRVDVHPTAELDGRSIQEIYEHEVRAVRHHHSTRP
jgi:zinc transport system ATP-binding protein